MTDQAAIMVEENHSHVWNERAVAERLSEA